MCSLPPTYNSIVTAWANIPDEMQTLEKLKTRLLQLESLLLKQNGEPACDAAFFTRSNKFFSQNRQPHYDQNKEYIKDLKNRTRCYNCGERDHWTAECPRPQRDKDKFSNQPRNKFDRQQKHPGNRRGEANVATSEQSNQPTSETTYEGNPSGGNAYESNHDDSYLFMAVSKHSQALSVNLDKHAWYADSGATEHMTEHRHWISTFQDVPHGTWSVVVADDRDLWVRGLGDINITRIVDGIEKRGILKKVLYIPNLRRNLFSIGLVSKAGLSFQTLGDKCVLYADMGRGPKVMEGNQVGTLYRLSISPVPPLTEPLTQTEDQIPSTAFATSTASRDTDLVLWQNRMAHVNIHNIKNMSDSVSMPMLQIFQVFLTADFFKFVQDVHWENNTNQHTLLIHKWRDQKNLASYCMQI